MRVWKLLLLFSLMIQISLGTWGPQSISHAADMPSPKKKILEITDSGISELSTQMLPSTEYAITTMSMKRFVAIREELDGRYDAIYIGSGKYSTAQVSYPNMTNQNSQSERANAHNTKDIMNDITNLKAEAIKKEFISKGQLVVLHTDTVTKNTGKLKSQFIGYKSNPVKNVIFVSSAAEAASKIGQNIAARPRLELLTQPSDYTLPTHTIYGADQTISYTFKLANNAQLAGHNLSANLYIDADFDKVYEPDELVSTTAMTASDSVKEIQYTLPKGLSTLYYWKLEIVDEGTKLKDFATGIFQFRDQKVHVRVLQVTVSSNDVSDLNKRIKSTYLDNQTDYDLDITTVSINDFNNSYYKSLNGNYDMLVFGFRDTYNEGATITTKAAEAVQSFISTGQGVMFSHDTIYRSSNNWLTYFKDITGQKDPMHNLGLGAPNPSTTTKQVNSGLLTQYPFALGDSVTVATTHDQYFTLDLEDPAVIPWYNMAEDNRDIADSWNHYYTYSKGSVTYSGTGHTSNSFPDSEQKLFVNTLYRAFIGANHAPFITMITPNDKEHIRSTDKTFDIAYRVDDYDLKDFLLKTRIYVDGSLVYSNDRAGNGSTVIYNAENTATNGGEIEVKVELEDSKGAKQTITRTVIVDKVTPALALSRKLVDVNPERIAKNSPFQIRYTIEPRDIPLSSLAVTGLRPIWMPQQNYVLGNAYSFRDVTRGNFGPIAWTGKNDRAAFLQLMKAGYSTPVALYDSIDTMTGNNLKSEIEGGFDYLYKQKMTITLPIIDETVLRGNSTVATALNFGRFEVKKDSSGDYVGVFRGYVYNLSNDQLTLQNLRFDEVYPSGIEVVGNSEAWTPSQSDGKSRISGSLQDISYTLSPDGKGFRAAKKEFTVTVRAVKSGLYTLNQSQLKYTDFTSADVADTFNSMTFHVYTAVTGVALNKEQLVLIADDPSRNSEQLIATVFPDDAENKGVKWTSSDENVATVDAKGRVVATGSGQATITVITLDGGFTDTCVVIVPTAPLISMTANQGWNSLYPDKVTITAEVVHGKEDGPLQPDFRINGQPLAPAKTAGPTPVDASGSLYKTVYTLEIAQNQTEAGGPFIGPAVISGQVKNRFDQLSEQAEGKVYFNPVVLVTAAGERETGSQTAKLTAVPSGAIMPNATFGWTNESDNSKVNHQTRLVDFTDGSITHKVPLKDSKNYFVVVLRQDFNEDQDTTDPNEMSVSNVVTIGGEYPLFTAEPVKDKTFDDIGLVKVTPIDNITDETVWRYATSKGEAPDDFRQTNGVETHGDSYLQIPYQKDSNGNPVKTTVVIQADNGDGYVTNRTIVLEVPVLPVGSDSPYAFVTATKSAQENRAVSVRLGYSFNAVHDPGNVEVNVTKAQFTIAPQGSAAGTPNPLPTDGIFTEKYLNLKSDDSKTKTYLVTVDVWYTVTTYGKDHEKNISGVKHTQETAPITVLATGTRQ
ncbi:DUF5057 domain-containing protein [Brevibacillus sp. GCM10020057]|uniref:DUF5057 domain-containing protein n=1 Tax=Brevibacillus sp. GCM10020057 TaxID=3317327 RepID=UPI003644C750